MIDIRSRNRKVNHERRRYPRLELHCKALVQGLDGVFKVTDIGIGGVFIEPRESLIVKIGQIASIQVKLPGEQRSIQLKVKFVSQNKKGIGCEFIDLGFDNKYTIDKCLDEFNHTLPIRNDEPLNSSILSKRNNASILCPLCKKKKTIDISKYINVNQNIKIKINCSCGHSWFSRIGKRKQMETPVNPTKKYKHVKFYIGQDTT